MPNPVELRDYRPVGLVGCLYNFWLRFQQIRLKKVLLAITSHFQRAFVAGRQSLMEFSLLMNSLTLGRGQRIKRPFLKLTWRKLNTM